MASRTKPSAATMRAFEIGRDADFGRYGQRTDVVFHQGPVQIGLWLSRLGIALESDVYVRKGGFQAVGVYLIAVE